MYCYKRLCVFLSVMTFRHTNLCSHKVCILTDCLYVFRAESFLLRAQRPELAIKFYRDAGMWQDVLRVAKEYLPHKLPQLQDEYERDMMEKSTK